MGEEKKKRKRKKKAKEVVEPTRTNINGLMWSDKELSVIELLEDNGFIICPIAIFEDGSNPPIFYRGDNSMICLTRDYGLDSLYLFQRLRKQGLIEAGESDGKYFHYELSSKWYNSKKIAGYCGKKNAGGREKEKKQDEPQEKVDDSWIPWWPADKEPKKVTIEIEY